MRSGFVSMNQCVGLCVLFGVARLELEIAVATGLLVLSRGGMGLHFFVMVFEVSRQGDATAHLMKLPVAKLLCRFMSSPPSFFSRVFLLLRIESRFSSFTAMVDTRC